MSSFASYHIYRQQLLAEYPADQIEDVLPRLQNLRHHQKEWATLSMSKRMELLSHLGERLTMQKDLLADMICEEVGRCRAECAAEIQKSLDLIKYYTQIAPNLLARKSITTQATVSEVAFEPLGVILAVMPWNYPVWQILRFAIPALCAGNACVVKPAPSVARVSHTLRDLIGDALPFSLACIEHQDIECLIQHTDALAFTGSTKTGSYLASLAGKHLKKCVMELGGSNPFIVMADADIQAAAKDACRARFRDAGQSCNAAKRIIVVPEIADEFIAQFIEHCRTLKTGDPMHPETSLACLHLPSAALSMQNFVDDAIFQGAQCLLGGKILSQHQYAATVLDHVPLNAKVATEEVFGPVVAIFRAQNAEDAIRIANHTPYGLGASIYTSDLQQAHQWARQLEAGSVFINRHTSSDLRMPFGGVKSSGFGRELSEFGLYEFVNIKSYWQK